MAAKDGNYELADMQHPDLPLIFVNEALNIHWI